MSKSGYGSVAQSFNNNGNYNGGYGNNNGGYGNSNGGYGNNNGGYSNNNSQGGGGYVYPAAGGSQNNSQKQASVEKILRPITCKQIVNAAHNQDDSSYKIDGVEVSQVCLVGVIMSITKTSTNTKFQIDDSTGQVEVTKWTDKDGDQESVDKLDDEFNESDYVLVHGHLREYKGKMTIGSYKIIRITDPNMITHHYLEVVRVHLEFTRGRRDANTNRGGMPQQQQQFNNGNASYMQPQQGSCGNRLQDSVRSFMENYKGDSDGVAIDEVVNMMRNFASEQDVRGQISMLVDEGFIYTTKDEFHISLS